MQKWPEMNEKTGCDVIEHAADRLERVTLEAASAASRAQRAFSEATPAQRNRAIEAAETLARAELGLSPDEPLTLKTWLSFDMACAGKLGLIPLASQAKLARDEAKAFLEKLPTPPTAMDIARAELAVERTRKELSEASLAHADRRADVLPYTGVLLRPAQTRNLTLDELRQTYESRTLWTKFADLFARLDIHQGADALRRATAEGVDPFALARAEQEAETRAREARQAFKEANEGCEALKKAREIHSARKEAAERPSPWLDDSTPTRARTMVFEDSRDWSAAFEQLSRTRPHLAPMAAAAAGAALGLSALRGAAQRCSSEQAGLTKAAGHLSDLQKSMRKQRSKSGSSAKAQLKFDMNQVYEGALQARQRFTELAASGPATLLERARRFQPGDGQAPLNALNSARAVFGEATPSLAKPQGSGSRSSDSGSSSSSFSSSTSSTGPSTWEALFWHQMLFDASHQGAIGAASGANFTAAPELDFGQSSGSASWASSEFSSASSFQASSSCSSRSSCSGSSCSSRSSCASSGASSCSSSSPSSSCSSSSCSSGSSCSSCSS